MKIRLKSKLSVLFLALALLLAIPAAALADIVRNDIVADTGNNQQTKEKSYTIGDTPAKVGYFIDANNSGGLPGCDAADGSPATINVNVPSESGVSVSKSSLRFTSCGDANKQFVDFTGTKEGKYTITISVADARGDYNSNNATFFLNVHAPAPQPPADTTPPVISADVTGQQGLAGWYVGDVNVKWNVSDPESNVSSRSGCDETNITSDTNGTTLTCEATSAGGTSSKSVTIKRDATAPTVTPDDVSNNVWRNSPLSQAFEASDSGSGLANASDASFTLTASDESAGANQPTTDSRTVSDVAGNSTKRSLSALIDLTRPVLNVSDSNGSAINVCDGPIRPTFAPSDALSGLDGSQGDSWVTPGGAPSLGNVYTYSANATDNAGNVSAFVKEYTANRYGGAYGGILQPINASGTSNFKLGSTVPVKFQLSCGGQPISNAVASLWVSKVGATADGALNEAISTSAATTGNLFRYSESGQQYIFNLSTKSGYVNPNGSTVSFATGGKYQLTIKLDDGTTRTAQFDILK